MKTLKTPIIIAAILTGVAIFLPALGFTSKQVISSVVFLMILCGTLFYWKFRLAFAFTGIAVLLGTKLLDVPHVIEFAGLDIILFLVGMMTIIGFLEENHFFEYLVSRVVDRVGERPYLLISILMSMAFFSAALVDEVTSILFMMSTVFHITKRYKVNPVPFLLMVVFATNIGSSATAVGNPIGVMIALRAQLTFVDFLRWAAPISLACLGITILLSFFLFKKPIAQLEANMKKKGNEPHELERVSYTRAGIYRSWILFLATVICLVLHHSIEEALHLEKNTLLIGTALFFGGISVFLKGSNAREFFMRRVDWWTLTFFMSLFASVGTLKYAGVTEQIAKGMIRAGQGGNFVLLNIFTAAVSLLTAFMDNVLAVATFIPILADIQKIGVYIFPFWWAMLFGGTMFGNATVIGSTANIVAVGMLEKDTGEHIKFMDWLKPGLVVSVVTVVVAMLLLYAQFHLMPGAPSKF
ncbi:MAG: Na(+)/H(+) antiporter NhaD [Candidatus Omnitrophica bacterium ADurb.Bin277]|nr:MAG: Na(+)/H(+) antiporter NhaD [Candidatus Omnitrophica bacterium ADurb.Bin277]